MSIKPTQLLALVTNCKFYSVFNGFHGGFEWWIIVHIIRNVFPIIDTHSSFVSPPQFHMVDNTSDSKTYTRRFVVVES